MNWQTAKQMVMKLYFTVVNMELRNTITLLVQIYTFNHLSVKISFSILDAVTQIPMVLTRQTNMTYYYNNNFYVMTEPDPMSIGDAINSITVDKKSEELSENCIKTLNENFIWSNLKANTKICTKYYLIMENDYLKEVFDSFENKTSPM